MEDEKPAAPVLYNNGDLDLSYSSMNGLDSSTPQRAAANTAASAWSEDDSDHRSEEGSTYDVEETRANGGHPLLLSRIDLQRLESIMSTASMVSGGPSYGEDILDDFDEADDNMKDFALQFAREIISKSQRLIYEEDNDMDNSSLLAQIPDQQEEMSEDGLQHSPVDVQVSILDMLAEESEGVNVAGMSTFSSSVTVGENPKDGSVTVNGSNHDEKIIEVPAKVASVGDSQDDDRTGSYDLEPDADPASGDSDAIFKSADAMIVTDNLVDFASTDASSSQTEPQSDTPVSSSYDSTNLLEISNDPFSLGESHIGTGDQAGGEIKVGFENDFVSLDTNVTSHRKSSTTEDELIPSPDANGPAISSIEDFAENTIMQAMAAITNKGITESPPNEIEESEPASIAEKHDPTLREAEHNDLITSVNLGSDTPKVEPTPDNSQFDNDPSDAGETALQTSISFDNDDFLSQSKNDGDVTLEDEETKDAVNDGGQPDSLVDLAGAEVSKGMERRTLTGDEEETLQSMDDLKNEMGLDLLPNLGDVPEDYHDAPTAEKEEYISDDPDTSISSEGEVSENIITDIEDSLQQDNSTSSLGYLDEEEAQADATTVDVANVEPTREDSVPGGLDDAFSSAVEIKFQEERKEIEGAEIPNTTEGRDELIGIDEAIENNPDLESNRIILTSNIQEPLIDRGTNEQNSSDFDLGNNEEEVVDSLDYVEPATAANLSTELLGDERQIENIFVAAGANDADFGLEDCKHDLENTQSDMPEYSSDKDKQQTATKHDDIKDRPRALESGENELSETVDKKLDIIEHQEPQPVVEETFDFQSADNLNSIPDMNWQEGSYPSLATEGEGTGLSLEQEMNNAMQEMKSSEEEVPSNLEDIGDMSGQVEEDTETLPSIHSPMPEDNGTSELVIEERVTLTNASVVKNEPDRSDESGTSVEPQSLTTYRVALNDDAPPSNLESWNSQEELSVDMTEQFMPPSDTELVINSTMLRGQLSSTSDDDPDEHELEPSTLTDEQQVNTVREEVEQTLEEMKEEMQEPPISLSPAPKEEYKYRSANEESRDRNDASSAAASSSEVDSHELDRLDELRTPTLDSRDLELTDSMLNAIDTPEVEHLPEFTAQEEMAERRNIKEITIDGQQLTLDMSLIEKYRGIYAHGGYVDPEYKQAIIVLSACYFPEKTTPNYSSIMDQLFYYVYHSVQQLVVEEFAIIYLQGGAKKSQLPGLTWMKRCHDKLGRSMRKSIKSLYIAHPTFWTRTVIFCCKPFVSSKFSRKIHLSYTLEQLNKRLSLQNVPIPDMVRIYDASHKQG